MTMSNYTSLNISLLEVMIAANDQCGVNSDVSSLPFQIIFVGWWALMNVGSKHAIA
jgi:hypothetical protein